MSHKRRLTASFGKINSLSRIMIKREKTKTLCERWSPPCTQDWLAEFCFPSYSAESFTRKEIFVFCKESLSLAIGLVWATSMSYDRY